MTAPVTKSRNLIERYQDYRSRRFLKHERAWSHRLPRWRVQRRRRLLVIGLALALSLMVLTGVLCAFGMQSAALLWLPACALFFPLWIALQIVSGRQGDAPRAALDEFEIAQRDSARSIGLTLTQYLTLVPIFYLIIGSTQFPSSDLAYAGGLLALAAVLIGGCAPAMILAWTQPDPEPDNVAT